METLHPSEQHGHCTLFGFGKTFWVGWMQVSCVICCRKNIANYTMVAL